MPIGIFINCAAVLLGGLLGAALGSRIPKQLSDTLTLICGLSSMAMGINNIVKMKFLPAVILAVILGTAVGELLHLEAGIAKAAAAVKAPLEKILRHQDHGLSQEEFMARFISIIVLFCASGTGIFGALQSGMTGDHTVLITKSILDFVTAAIFATTLGYLVSIVCLPQLVVLLALFFSAGLIMSVTTPDMLADFSACGGVLMLATGFRISGIKNFPIANMLFAMVLVMPFSFAWSTWILPLL